MQSFLISITLIFFLENPWMCLLCKVHAIKKETYKLYVEQWKYKRKYLPLCDRLRVNEYYTQNFCSSEKLKSAQLGTLFISCLWIEGRYIGDIWLFQGWMEPTVLFYGYYADRSLAIGTFEGQAYSYNMPIAYLVVTIIILAASLILMVRQ